MEDTIRGRAEDIQARFNVLLVLLDSVDTNVSAIIAEKSMTGAIGEMIRQDVRDIQTLLGVVNDYIWRMDKDQSEIVRALFAMQGGGAV